MSDTIRDRLIAKGHPPDEVDKAIADFEVEQTRILNIEINDLRARMGIWNYGNQEMKNE